MAYADFLTALMAFFLVMWLVSGVSPEARAQVADYFTGGSAAVTAQAPDTHDADIQRLYDLLKQDEALRAAGDSIVLAKEADGVRLDLVDTEARPLFDTASGKFTEAGTALAASIGRTLATLATPLTVEGHTDAFPSADPARTNWDISSERANSALRLLSAQGVAADRIRAVTGLAETRPLNPGEPHLSANRRVSILLHVDG